MLCYEQIQTLGEGKGEDGNIGLKISAASFILVPSVRQSSWYGLGLPGTLGSIKQPLAASALAIIPRHSPQICSERRELLGYPGPQLHHGYTLWAVGLVALHPSSGGQLVSRSCNPHAMVASVSGLLFQYIS